jgi:hypothetical protein
MDFIIKYVISSAALIAITFSLNAQSFGFAYDYDNEISTFHLTLNNSNQILTVGKFSGNVDFDFSSKTYNLQTEDSLNIQHTASYLAKYDANGNFITATKFAEYSNLYTSLNQFTPTRIIEGRHGNYYVAGAFIGTINFGTGSKNAEHTNFGGESCIIIKYDSAFNHIWSRHFAGNGSEGISLVTDYNENIFITGTFSDSVDFDPDSVSYVLSTGNQNISNIFLCKLGSAGDFMFTHSFGTSNYPDIG